MTTDPTPPPSICSAHRERVAGCRMCDATMPALGKDHTAMEEVKPQRALLNRKNVEIQQLRATVEAYRVIVGDAGLIDPKAFGTDERMDAEAARLAALINDGG